MVKRAISNAILTPALPTIPHKKHMERSLASLTATPAGIRQTVLR